ncbi:MAG: LytR family transcriptional regulator [Candidatus Moranbacteria bacterium]|nr:LytR family transcriptional regulator [Candidatus Moranbacteria bacterium]
MKIKKNYIFPEVMATLVQYGIPLGYTLWAYDVFGGSHVVKQVTGGTILFFGIIYFALRNRIKKFVDDYNQNLGDVAKKAKWGIAFAFITLFLSLAQFWIEGALVFIGTLAVSNFLSLPLYAISRNRETKYKELKAYIKNKQLEEQYFKANYFEGEHKIKILNGTSVPGLARKLRNTLIKDGFNVVEFGTSAYPPMKETVIICRKSDFFVNFALFFEKSFKN